MRIDPSGFGIDTGGRVLAGDCLAAGLLSPASVASGFRPSFAFAAASSPTVRIASVNGVAAAPGPAMPLTGRFVGSVAFDMIAVATGFTFSDCLLRYVDGPPVG